MGTKRTRALTALGAVFLGGVAALAAAGAMMDWLVIDLRTAPGHEGPRRLWLPVPVAALRLAAAAAPALGEPAPEALRKRLPAIRSALGVLARCPDSEFVRIETNEATVRIAKRGGELTLEVRAPEAAIHGAIPIAGLVRAARRLDGGAAPVGPALALLDDGFELTVDAEEATVRLAVR